MSTKIYKVFSEFSAVSTSIILIGVYILFQILYIGGSFIIPLILAFFLSFALIGLYNFINSYQKNTFLSFLATVIAFVFGISIFIWIINNNLQQIMELAPSYEEKIIKIVDGILALLGIESKFSFDSMIENIDLPNLIGGVGNFVSSLVGLFGTIALYSIFIIAEYAFLGNKLNNLFDLSHDPKKMREIFQKIRKDVVGYFKIHTLMSLITGFGTFLVCLLFGVDFAAFWGLLAFLLNYIPTIGSIVGWFAPSLFAFVQFGSEGAWWSFLFVTSFVGAIQFGIGNILEPKYLGSKLNLSPLVILLSLAFWGALWGIMGMFLSMPIMVMLNIIFSKFESTQWMHILLSEKGK